MNWLRNLLLLLTGLIAFAPSAFAQRWVVGEEVEVDTNFYATLTEEFRGWRIWRFDELGGHTCAAVRPAEGLPHPTPAGDTVQMTHRGNSPYIDIRAYRDGVLMGGINTYYYGDPTVQLRRPGDRFWTEVRRLYDDVARFAGQVYEVDAESWEYPALNLGLMRERGVLDLTDMDAAVTRAVECARTP